MDWLETGHLEELNSDYWGIDKVTTGIVGTLVELGINFLVIPRRFLMLKFTYSF